MSPPQSAAQAPPAHTGVAPEHTVEPPQAIGFDCGSMQPPPSPRTRPGRHAHDESEQYSVSEHVVPQPPQWSTSLVRFAHRPSQLVCPSAHWHAPLSHVPPVEQLAPSPTQVSLSGSQQPPSQKSPGQQGSPAPPQARQASPSQARLGPHWPLSQQGSPGPPQLAQEPPWQMTAPAVQKS